MQVLQLALNNLFIDGGGNDQGDIEVVAMAELLTDNLRIN